ncbi:MAG: 2-hydroxyhepta-2,4-diene-1,7-dioate isomerase [Bacteroidetes bacterium GWE2_42_24]|nr:MAG: 2-hydroxyhepta-2,4-diene-1,7-dioate isomerase [Bacteroidetes bacterium GWE2_42_24]OFY25421.1 MAG: 2-hydroxyhepta-2,4-diene-1,7-dioate isomerase [Bacteroidetes bacterium GWF2_43_11]PKP23999.1 MAG: 2-hydroxyhepta-2,4-diene-1,7-dioate isomerase [Bacteroidetes bacterium HGW-Bacteroidetes-22]
MKIICIGRNYKEHARELNNPVPESPVFFMKPETALLPKRHPVFYPEFTQDLQYEVELVLRISRLGKHIETRFAHTYYNAIGIGIDFTARDLQAYCKKNGLPWEMAKSFDFSAPVGKFFPVETFQDKGNIAFSLFKNKEIVQKGNTSEMIFTFEELISYVSKFVTIKEGDLIFTGTPAGVGSVNIGDRLDAFIGEESCLKVDIR